MRKSIESVGKRRDKKDGVEDYDRVKRSQKSETTRLWRDAVQMRCKTASEKSSAGLQGLLPPLCALSECTGVHSKRRRRRRRRVDALWKMQLMLCGEA